MTAGRCPALDIALRLTRWQGSLQPCLGIANSSLCAKHQSFGTENEVLLKETQHGSRAVYTACDMKYVLMLCIY